MFIIGAEHLNIGKKIHLHKSPKSGGELWFAENLVAGKIFVYRG